MKGTSSESKPNCELSKEEKRMIISSFRRSGKDNTMAEKMKYEFEKYAYSKQEPKYKRVAIVGTHGAGKSTLLSSLPLSSKITEKARELIEKYGTTPNNLPYRERVGFENEILISHIGEEEKSIAKNGYFVSDRSRFDVLVYANELGLEEEDLRDLEEMADGSPRYDKIFYVPIEFPLSEDYARWGGEEFQRKVDLKLRELLLKKGYELTEVRGTVKERVDFILKTLYEA